MLASPNAVPRTIFDDDKTRHFYDQLVWFSQPDGTSLPQGLTHGSEVSRRISDHYPLWCEFLLT